MDKKYVVPEGGLKAALGQVDYARAHSGVEEGIIKRALQDFVRWLSENPVVPTADQVYYLQSKAEANSPGGLWKEVITGWQRRMFLAPEESKAEMSPEEILNLLSVEINRVGGIRKAIDILKKDK